MSVIYNETRRIFKLDTENTSYLIGISPEGYVGHVYYGEYLELIKDFLKKDIFAGNKLS